MFEKLSDLKYRRTPEQALGFFLAAAVVLFVTLIVLGPLMNYAGVLGRTPQEARIAGGAISLIFGMLYCVTLAVAAGFRKKMDSAYLAGLAVLTALAAIPHGVFGLFVVAYMTTLPMGWPVHARKKAAVRRASQSARQAPPRPRPVQPPPAAPEPPLPAEPVEDLPPPVPPYNPDQPNQTVVSQAMRKTARIHPDPLNEEPVDDRMQ